MFPRRFEPVLFGFVLSSLMSLLVSGISTLMSVGAVSGFLQLWLRAWLTAWPVAFPVVLIVAPMARRLVQRLIPEGVGVGMVVVHAPHDVPPVARDVFLQVRSQQGGTPFKGEERDDSNDGVLPEEPN